MSDLTRLLAPKVIAVIGGGAWCASIIGAARNIGFEGRIVPVHPTKAQVAGVAAVASVEAVDGVIDAAFVGVNRQATIEVVRALRAVGAGGAICFASGFSEAAAEDASGGDLQAALIEAAGDMPILGPNCYGFLNALDQTGIWPDQHAMTPVDRGVAILTQSSNMAINLTMQKRGVPIAMMITCGNMAQTDQSTLARNLLADPRITAIGLHIEGFGDLRGWEALAEAARARGVPLIALKSGKSAQAQAATISHTASLAGGDAGAAAFLERLGIARVDDVPVFLETLKMAHVFGPLPSAEIASISCSGGEASLVADTAHGREVNFPPLTAAQRARLGAALGPMVALANPLDYHTYIWRDDAAMARAWSAMAADHLALVLAIVDYPREDLCDPSDWVCATNAAIEAARVTGARFAVVATLPELMPEPVARQLMAHGVGAFHGLTEVIAAIEALSRPQPSPSDPVLLPAPEGENTNTLTEAEAKAALSAVGVRVPKSVSCPTKEAAAQATQAMQGPVAVKVQGLAHKSGAGGLALGLRTPQEVMDADLVDGPLLVEEMVTGTVVEVLVGITRDPAHGYVLTLAAGGVLTEILDDSASLLVPAGRDQVDCALDRLRIAPVLRGYRGQPPVDRVALLDAVMAIQSYVVQEVDHVAEVEVNPLLCTPTDAIAVDALIRRLK